MLTLSEGVMKFKAQYEKRFLSHGYVRTMQAFNILLGKINTMKNIANSSTIHIFVTHSKVAFSYVEKNESCLV